MPSLIGNVGVFSEGEEDIDSYLTRIDLFFTANNIKREKYVPSFLALVGAKIFSLVKDLVAPKKPAECEYDELVKALREHFKPQVIVIYERFKFYSRNQGQSESIAEFVAGIKACARTCEFGDKLEEMLRDRLVMGLRDEGTQRHLLTVKDLKFAEAVEISCSRAAAAKDVVAISSHSNSNVNFVKRVNNNNKNSERRSTGTDGRPNKHSNNNKSFPKSNCFGCGGKHWKNDCPFKNAVCHNCKKSGHIRRVCKSNINKDIKSSLTNYTFASNNDNEVLSEYLFNVNDHSKPINKDVIINNFPVSMILDTGSSKSIMSYREFSKFNPKPTLNKTNIELLLYGNIKLDVQGVAEVTVNVDSKIQKLKLYVVKENGPNLLGRDWIEALNLNASVYAIIDNTKDILSEFPDLFANKLGKFNKYPVKLDIDPNIKPVFCKARPLPYIMKDKVNLAIDKMLKDEIIVPVNYAEWAAPVVPVLKPDNSVRLCGDYRLTVNKAAIIDKYPLPKIDELISSLNNCKVFSKLDMSQAYLQLCLDEDSKPLTTINTHRGLFQFNRLCFGVSSAPGIFQRVMENLLRDIPGVVCYLDDCVVAGLNREEHDSRLRMVFERFQEAGLKLRKEKCKLFTNKISYLGYILDSNGVHPNPDKVKAISEAPVPTNITQLQSYLGLLNFYRKFISNASDMLGPLNKLLSKGVTWHWGPQQERAFQISKKVLLDSSVLVHFDPKYPVQVVADSSSYGIGAVLSHIIDGVERPVFFASRTLTKVERKYSQLEREALALIFALKRFHFYIYGLRFTLVTDHKPLLGLFSQDRNIPIMASGRIQRWSLMLQAYNFDLKHKSGEKLGAADTLSRLPLDNPCEFSPVPTEWVHLCTVMEGTPVNATIIARDTIHDSVLSLVYKYCESGWPRVVEPSLRCYAQRSTELSIQGGCVLWGNRVVIPSKFRRTLLEELHIGHVGSSRMKELARSYFWWPGLNSDIESLVNSCSDCMSCRSVPKRGELHPWEWPKSPWHRLHIDYAGPLGGMYFLVVVDAHSKWVEVFPTKSITSSMTIQLLRSCFARFGLPVSLVSDNGTCFTSQEFKNFMKLNGVHHITTAVFHPSSNGLAENMVKNFKKSFKLSVGDVSEKISKFLFSYRVTPHTTTGTSPAELMLGRKLRTVFDLIKPQDKLNTRVVIQQEKQKEYFKPKIPRRVNFNVKDNVMVRNYSRGDKWIPAVITEKTGPVSYRCETGNGIKIKRHQDQMIERTVSEVNESEPIEPLECSSNDLTSSSLRRSSRVSRAPERLDL